MIGFLLLVQDVITMDWCNLLMVRYFLTILLTIPKYDL